MKNLELIKAEKYFLAIANTTTDMIHLNDVEGRIIYANQATETILGYSLNEILNIPSFEIIHPDDRQAIEKDMLSISTDNHLPSRDIRLLKKDGSYIDVEVRGFIVTLSENKYVGAIIRDISSRKRTEKELEAYRDNLEKLVEARTLELRNAINELRILRRILPLCSFCKKIRDDKGYWEQVDVYIHKHLDADITHGICPECAEKHYPEFFDKKGL